jgi:YesN/AraC family two-component response regulator
MYIKKQKANRLLFLKNKELVEKESKMQSKRDLVEIPESRQNEIIKKLNREMNENSIHLQTDLTLYSLSKALNTNSSYLSRIIQLNYNYNFSAFLNKHRIIEAQKMILDKSFAHYTIDAISHECGYKSKSTFNKAFKEITGLTPNEYKRQGEL